MASACSTRLLRAGASSLRSASSTRSDLYGRCGWKIAQKTACPMKFITPTGQALRRSSQRARPANLTIQDCRTYARDRFELGRAPATVNTEARSCARLLTLGLQAPHNTYQRRGLGFRRPGASRNVVLRREDLVRLLQAAEKGDPHVYVFGRASDLHKRAAQWQFST